MQKFSFYYGITAHRSPLNKSTFAKESTTTVVSTLPFSVFTPEFSSCPSQKSLSLLLKSSLFCKLCCPYHFWCHAFVQRLLLPASVSILTFSMSPTYLEQVWVWSLSYVSSAHSGSMLVLDDVGCINALLSTVSPHQLHRIIWDWN